MPTFATLPPEIHHQTADYLTERGIASLQCTSRHFRDVLKGRLGLRLEKAPEHRLRELLRRFIVEDRPSQIEWLLNLSPFLVHSIDAEFSEALSVIASSNDHVNALDLASMEGNAAVARVLLKHGASVHGGNDMVSPLMHAIEKSKVEMVRLLLEHGADHRGVAASSRPCAFRRGRPPVLIALELYPFHRNEDVATEIVKLLVEHGRGANVNTVYWDVVDGRRSQTSLLQKSAIVGCVGAFTFLYGKSLPPPSVAVLKEMLVAAIRFGNGRHVDVAVEILANLPKDILNAQISTVVGDAFETGTPLHFACLYGNNDAVDFLIREGADVNIRRAPRGETPAFCAVSRGNIYATEKLIKAGADLSIPDKHGVTVLEIARKGRPLASSSRESEPGVNESVEVGKMVLDILVERKALTTGQYTLVYSMHKNLW